MCQTNSTNKNALSSTCGTFLISGQSQAYLSIFFMLHQKYNPKSKLHWCVSCKKQCQSSLQHSYDRIIMYFEFIDEVHDDAVI